MSKIGDFFTWLFLSLVLLWATGLIFSPNKCTRVYRASWPVTYLMGAAEAVSKNWTTDATKLTMLQWKAKGVIWSQETFETTVYGDEPRCKK